MGFCFVNSPQIRKFVFCRTFLMINEDYMETVKDDMIKAVVDHINEEGIESINSLVDGYDKTKKIVWKNSGRGYFPDITARHDGQMFIFEVLAPGEEVNENIDKWKLFNAFSRANNGKFYVVAMASNEYTVKNALNEYNLNAQILTLGQ